MSIVLESTRNFAQLLECLTPDLGKTNVNRLGRIAKAMISMTGRVTMLGISRWGEKGCSYRTVQRFYNSAIDWPKLFINFVHKHFYNPTHHHILTGDECVSTKSGKETHGLDYFFFQVY